MMIKSGIRCNNLRGMLDGPADLFAQWIHEQSQNLFDYDFLKTWMVLY